MPMIWFGSAGSMDTWADMDGGVIRFASPEDAKKAEAIFNELRGDVIEECAVAVEGSLKERQPAAFYADVIRALKDAR